MFGFWFETLLEKVYVTYFTNWQHKSKSDDSCLFMLPGCCQSNLIQFKRLINNTQGCFFLSNVSFYCCFYHGYLILAHREICKFSGAFNKIICCSTVSHYPLCVSCSREQPIFSARAHVFQIDPATKRNWIPASKHAVTVSFFYDANRNVYRIISVGGTKVRENCVIGVKIVALSSEEAVQYLQQSPRPNKTGLTSASH